MRTFGDTVYLATAVDGGVVRVFGMTSGQERFRFMPFPGFTGRIFVTTADLTGDFIPDIVVAVGPGGGPHVKVFSGVDPTVLASFFAYDPAFHGGVFVAVGDVNGDGTADIVTGAGPGGGPRVKVFSVNNLVPIIDFMAATADDRDGVPVTTKDLDDDGRAEIVTGVAFGWPSVVRFFDPLAGQLLDVFQADWARRNGGVFVG